MKTKNNTVAKAIRMELDTYNDKLYLIFEVIDNDFKKKVRESWTNDIPVELIGKELKEI